MNKKVLLIGLISYALVVAIGGFLLFAKQSPLTWSSQSLYPTAGALCYSCSYEQTTGDHIKVIAQPFMESYISDDMRFTNRIAKFVNDNISYLGIIFTITSIMYFAIIWKISGKDSE